MHTSIEEAPQREKRWWMWTVWRQVIARLLLYTAERRRRQIVYQANMCARRSRAKPSEQQSIVATDRRSVKNCFITAASATTHHF